MLSDKNCRIENGVYEKIKVFNRLCCAIGSENVSDKEVDKIAYSRDYWPITFRWLLDGRTPSLPDYICWPASTNEVSDIVKIACEEETPITPFGEGSGVLGGAIPVNGGIVVDLKQMNKILEINDENLIVTVQAGINLMNLERELNRRGYTMGHFPQSFYCSSLGGNLSTRAAGQFSTKYGKIDDIVISLEAVLPEGEIIRSKSVPKSSTGPAVERLLLGAEGTLGIVTEATLKIWPYPEERVLKSYAFEDLDNGLEAIRNILRKGLFPAVIRMYDKVETARHFYQTPKVKEKCMLILLLEGSKELVDVEARVSESLCMNYGGVSCGEEPVRHWLDTRFNVKEASEFAPKDVIFDTIEVVALWDRALNLYNSVISAMKMVKGVIFASAHASHFYAQGICLYFTFAGVSVKGKVEDFYKSVWDAAMKATIDAGGSISHHHGIGLMRAGWLKEELGESFETINKIKRALDPGNIMNPGKMGL